MEDIPLPPNAASVPDFPGYAIDTSGQLFTRWKHTGFQLRQRVLLPTWQAMKGATATKSKKYRVYRLHNEAGLHFIYAHRLVALAFIGPPPFEGAEVRHKNDDQANNAPDNLIWGTRKQNVEDAIRNGKHRVGEDAGLAKLTNEEVLVLVARIRNGERQRDVASECGLGLATVSRIMRGEKWGAITGIPKAPPGSRWVPSRRAFVVLNNGAAPIAVA